MKLQLTLALMSRYARRNPIRTYKIKLTVEMNFFITARKKILDNILSVSKSDF